MITGSGDKTARLWEFAPTTEEGNKYPPRLLRIFRPPINPNSDDGVIYAVAMHPEGDLVAVSGYTPSSNKGLWSLYIFDTNSAQIVATIEDNPFRITHLAFSPKGKYLVATMRRGHGMRVWTTGNWGKPIAEDSKDYGDSYGATFDNKGRLYTVAFNSKPNNFGYLRRYSAEKFHLESQVKIEGGLTPYHVAVQPFGDKVAVSQLNTAGVFLYHSADKGIEPLGNADTKDVPVGIGKIGWSADGQHLFAGGSYNNGTHYLFRMWANEGRGEPEDIVGPTGIISHIVPCGSYMAYGSRDPAFGLIDTNGVHKYLQSRVGINMRDKQFGHLKVSSDGMRVGFGLGYKSESPVIFNVAKLALLDALNGVDDLHSADYESLPITMWNERETIPLNERPINPLLNGQPIAPLLERQNKGEYKEEPYRISNLEEWISLAIASQKKEFVLGSEWQLRGYKSGTKKSLMWNIEVPGKVWALNISRNENLLVAGYDDGTIRWHRLDNGKELLALFVHAKDKRWIAWTPRGYFAASTGGEDLIGWHFNNGPKEAASFSSAYEYRNDFSRRDIVQRILIDLDEDVAIKLANRDIEQRSHDEITKLPDVIIHSPEPSPEFSDDSLDIKIRYSVNLPTGFESGFIEVLIDGIFYRRTDNLNRQQLSEGLTQWVNLEKRNSVVSLVAYTSRIGKDKRKGKKSIPFKYVGLSPTSANLPKLIGIAIGIGDNYRDEDKLEFPDDDAIDFIAALEAQIGYMFRDVKIEPLINDDASKLTIITEIETLSVEAMKDNNTISVIYYSGHGVMSGRDVFYIMPEELDVTEEYLNMGISQRAYVTQVGLSQYELYDLIATIPGRKLLFFDACRSGSVNITDFINMMNGAGTLSSFTYTSTDSGDISQECENNGCFTKALVEALNSGPTAHLYSPISETSTEELRRYLRKQVPLYSSKQHPRMLASDKNLQIFGIAKH